MSEKDSDLRQPIGIYILGLLFILAPLGNIVLSLLGSGIEGWYRPSIFFDLLQTIPVADWLWLGGIFVAGIALLLRHKSAWIIAVLALVGVLGMNTYRAFTIDQSVLNPEFVRMQILVSILVTLSVLIIAFYARYPYLDRRQQWLFPTAHRYDVKTPVVVHVGDGIKGTTDSLSTAGVRIRLEKTSEALKNQTEFQVTFPELNDVRINTEVIELSGTTLRLKFKNFGWSSRGHLEAWLKSKSA